MKSLYCVRFKSPYNDISYWLYPYEKNDMYTEIYKEIKNTSQHLELLGNIKPFDSQSDAYFFIRKFMGYSMDDWYNVSSRMNLGNYYADAKVMSNMEFSLIDVTHDFKEVSKFKVSDIYYHYFLSSEYNVKLAENFSIESSSEFAKEIFKRTIYNTPYKSKVSEKQKLIMQLYKDFVEVRNLSSEAENRNKVTKFRPKKKKTYSYKLIAL